MYRIFHIVAAIYSYLFSLPILRELNYIILYFSLKAYGYYNYGNQNSQCKASGEEYFIEKILKTLDPKVCIDVGANVGSYTSLILSACENTRIYSFEPLDAPFRELEKLERHFGKRLIPINKGVGNKRETLPIHFSEKRTGWASFSEEIKNVSYVTNECRSDIEVTTLDHFFSNVGKTDRIDFIKIDTEGFEFEVLDGAREIISRFRPKAIQIEYNWHQLFREKTLFSFSRILDGYDVFQLLPNGLVERDPKDPLANIYEFSNFVFVRKDVRDSISRWIISLHIARKITEYMH
uniref:Methyltransferase, FkbM family n=1 Tax=Candidatus Kentrum sp. LFY TaxID=2126342 RepID=A0A450WUD5_9GAMM|nr:MAG: methyltransferase, FkbM family [Candidatus Kentron sp. LFY]